MKFQQIILEAPGSIDINLKMNPEQHKKWMDDQMATWEIIRKKEHLGELSSDHKAFNKFMVFIKKFGEKFSEPYEKYFRSEIDSLPSPDKMASEI